MPRVSLVTLGCRLNQAETEAMGEALESVGFDTVPFGQEAELTLINTCTVTQSADASSRRAIFRAKRIWPETKVVVTGCFAETHRGLEKMPEVTRVVANSKKEEILAELSDLFPEEILSGKFSVSSDFVSPNRTHTRAFVKIQNGCEEGCSYCIIPFSRGNDRSRPSGEVLAEILRLEKAGYKEVVLTGVHIGKYWDGRYRLDDLLKQILKQTKIPRLRLSSIKVNEVNEKLLELFRSEERICPHFHTPIQSGCDTVLERMKRRYRTSQVQEVLARLKEIRPDSTTGTDLIVGFPGETEEEFASGCEFIASLPVDHMHVFPYSDRPGTAASEMPDKVSPEIKAERGEKLRQLSEEKWKLHISRFVGRELSVLFESGRAREKGVSAGTADNYIRVAVPENENLPNQLLRVKILSVEGKSLRGRGGLKPLWAAVLTLAALAALVFSFRRDKKFLLSFFAFIFSTSFLVLPGLFGLENHLFLFGEGLSTWASAVFALTGLFFLFREIGAREEKVVVEAVPLAEFFRSLKEFLIHPYTLVEIFNLSLREAGRLWGLPAGAVFIYHSGTDELLLAASFGLSREQEKKWEKIRAKEELFSRSAKTGMSLAMGDLVHSRNTWAALAPFVNFGSLVSIPLVGRERVLGVLVLLAAEPYRFGRAEEEELGPVGLSLGMFADGVRIHRESRRRAEEAGAWRQELEKTLSGFASIAKGDALHNLLDLAAQRLPYRLGLILARRQEKWEVVSASLEPLVGDILSPVFTEAVANGCQTPEAKRLFELDKLTSFFEHPHELPAISEALLLPLVDDRKTIGAFLLGFEGGVPNGDYVRDYLSALAGIAVPLLSQPAAAHSENWVGALQTLATVKREEELRSFVDFALTTFFQFDTGFLFRLEEEKLRLAKNWGYPAFSPIELELEEGIWGRVAVEKTPLLVPRERAKEFMETVNRTAFDRILKATGGVGLPVSQMAVAISKGEKVWGVLSVERYRHSFAPTDFEKFAALAELVSIKLSALEQKSLGLDGGVAIGNEINNELTAIIGNLELTSAELPDGSPLRERLEDMVGLAQKTGEKVGQLAKNLSTLAGQNRDINRLLDEVVEAESKNLEADLSHLPEVRVDSEKLKGFLREVIHELMAKGETNALSLKTDTDNQYVYIRLLSKNPEVRTDSLAGVSFGQIFRSDFSRLEESLSPSDLGWITEAGGQVSLVEDQAAGRSLTLRFPIPKAAKKGWKKSLKILAIDDQEIIRDLLVNMFGSAGHEVTTAERGEEGIAKFKIQRFDLVVTDLSMPDLSGWEVAREVKKLRPDMPVILITGWGQNQDEEKLKESGVDRVVTKPFRIEQLMKTVEELLSKPVTR